MDEQTNKKTRTEYKNKYLTENYDQVRFVVPKGEKEKIKAAADAAGMSVNGFIQEAVREKMNK